MNSSTGESSPHLAINPVDLPILILQFAAHVDRHVSQITDHCVHLTHILFHLSFTGIVCNLGDVAALRTKSIAIVHHPLRLVVNYLAVIVSLPRAFIFLEAGSSVKDERSISKSLLYIDNSKEQDTSNKEISFVFCFKHFSLLLKIPKVFQDLQSRQKFLFHKN